MDRLFDDVASLYHLDEVKAQTSGKTDLGPLPWTARVLVGGLILSWATDPSLDLPGYLEKENTKSLIFPFFQL